MQSKKGSRLIACTLVSFAVSVLFLLFYLKGFWTLLDQAAFAWVATIRSDALTAFFHGLTYLGSGVTLIPLATVAAIAMLVKGYRAEAVTLVTTLVAAYLLNDVMKAVFARPRPEDFHVIDLPDSYSYPSGHAMVGPAFYLLLAYILYGWFRQKSWMGLLQVAAVLLAVLLPMSRVYLGVHYASDVLSGLALSLTMYFFASFCYRRWTERGSKWTRAPLNIKP